MTNTVKVIKKFHTDGRIEEGEWPMTLAQMQAFVGGSIEYVATTHGKQCLVVNEMGTMDNLPQNWAATEMVRPGVMMIDCIRGNALLVWA